MHYEIIERLISEGFEAYIVGGAIRDRFLNKNVHDYDIATNAKPDEIKNIFPDKNVNLNGKTFEVVMVDGIDVATYRIDHHNNDEWTVEYADNIYQDLGRRDLTINSMAQCVNGFVVDEYNGMNDLNKKIIRFVGDATKRITEDPCRIIRACRFLAKLNGRFSNDTFQALRENRHLIHKIAPERIRIEILKTMEIQNASRFFEALHEINILKDIFPSFEACWEHDHGNHHLESVSAHMLLSGDYMSTKFPLLKLAAYLHDCGKAEAYDPIERTFHQHEYIGRHIVFEELKKLKFTKLEVNYISGLIACHMQPGKNYTPKALRRFLKKLDEYNVSVQDFMRMRMADRAGNVKTNTRTLREWINMYKDILLPPVQEIPFNINALAIKGGELIKELGIAPGPKVGELQRHLLEYVLDTGEEFNTYESLLIEARNYLIKIS